MNGDRKSVQELKVQKEWHQEVNICTENLKEIREKTMQIFGEIALLKEEIANAKLFRHIQGTVRKPVQAEKRVMQRVLGNSEPDHTVVGEKVRVGGELDFTRILVQQRSYNETQETEGS